MFLVQYIIIKCVLIWWDDILHIDLFYVYVCFMSISGVVNFVPICDNMMKPFKGKIFLTLEDGIVFYKSYAAISGFDIRLGPTKKSDNIITWKYIFCNREGEKNAIRDEGIADKDSFHKKRRRMSKRVGCMARMVLRYSAGEGYVVKKFVESHNHTFVSEHLRHFMKVNRNLDFIHQEHILNCNRANIGPMKSYKLYKEMVGGHSNVGCTIVDFKNYSRDLKAYILGVDAQMMIDKLAKKREMCSGFIFEYDVDEMDRLRRMFWADPICRRDFHVFGDAISFDATYSTNR